MICPRAWNHPGATVETPKRILRAVLEEVVVQAEPGRLGSSCVEGGDHTSLDANESCRASESLV